MIYRYIGKKSGMVMFDLTWDEPQDVTDPYALKKLATHSHFEACHDQGATKKQGIPEVNEQRKRPGRPRSRAD